MLISASEQANLLAQLVPFALDDWLDGAHGIEDIYAASKEGIARRWLTEARVDPANVVFIDDSEHDYEIAAALGANCVLSSGGHHAREHLLSLGFPVIDHLSELPSFQPFGLRRPGIHHWIQTSANKRDPWLTTRHASTISACRFSQVALANGPVRYSPATSKPVWELTRAPARNDGFRRLRTLELLAACSSSLRSSTSGPGTASPIAPDGALTTIQSRSLMPDNQRVRSNGEPSHEQ